MEAGEPYLNAICSYCGVTQEQLLPNLAKTDCRQYLITGKCMYSKNCKFHHRTAKKDEIESIMSKLKRFKEDPLGMKKGGETTVNKN
jgi:hypothetical protein